MKLSAIQHHILFDYYTNKTNNVSTVTLNGKTYEITVSNTENIRIRSINTNPINTAFSEFKRLFIRGKSTQHLIQETITDHQDFRLAKIPFYDGICFSGGGAKGLAYFGVLQSLGKTLDYVKQVAGASAGALIATFVALGLSAEQIQTFVTTQSTKVTYQILEQQIKSALYLALNLPSYQAALQNIFGKPTLLKEDIENISFFQLEQLRLALKNQSRLKQILLSASYYNKAKKITSEVKLSASTTPNLPIYKGVIASAAIPLPWLLRKLGSIDLPKVPITKNELTDHNGETIYDNLFQLSEDQENILFLRDGGIHNNLPFTYLDQKGYNLILSFTQNKDIYKQALSLSNKIKELICGEPAYRRRQADHMLADQIGVCYLDPSIGTTDVKQGLKNLDHITRKSLRQFDYYLHTNQEFTCSVIDPYASNTCNILKYGPVNPHLLPSMIQTS